MSEKIYGVLEEAVLTAPMLLSLGEFDTDKDELVAEHRELAKQNPDDLIPAIKFVFEHGYLEYEYLLAIFKNDSLTRDALFHLLLLFVTEVRADIEEVDIAAFELGSRHPKFDALHFDNFLIDHINGYANKVAKNTLGSRIVLKHLVLQKGDDCVALETAISNPNMDFTILGLLAESFYLAHRDSTIRSVQKQMNDGSKRAEELGYDMVTSKVVSLLFLQSEFACACVHLELMNKMQDVAKRLMRLYNVLYEG